MTPLQSGRILGKKVSPPRQLGYSGSTSGSSNFQANWAFTTQATLAAGGTLTELHVKGVATSGTPHVKILIFSETAGAPSTLLHASASIAMTVDSVLHEYMETGLSIALAAGNYWLGLVNDGGGGNWPFQDPLSNSDIATSGFSFASPGNFPGGGSTGTRSYLAWGVVV